MSEKARNQTPAPAAQARNEALKAQQNLAGTDLSRENQLAAEFDEAMANSPHAGKPLTGRAMNFRLDGEAVKNAMLKGMPNWMIRLKRIERWKANMPNLLQARWESCCEQYPQGPYRASAWQSTMRRVKINLVNQWIQDHNEYYPVEANLPMSPKTHQVIDRDGNPFKALDPIDRAWLWTQSPSESQLYRPKNP